MGTLRRLSAALVAAYFLGTPTLALATNDAVPAQQLVGSWRDAKGVIVAIARNDNGAFVLTRDGVQWDEVDKYSPGRHSTLEFRHLPAAADIPDKVPDEIKTAAVAAGLEWRTKLDTIKNGQKLSLGPLGAAGDACKLSMSGTFLPGDIAWEKVTDKATGAVSNTFTSVKIGGKSRSVSLNQLRYALPDMGQWLEINEYLDGTAASAGLGQIASIPQEAQAYTDLGNLDAAILQGMYRGLTFNTPLDGPAKYAVKFLKDVALKKLKGADTTDAATYALGKMIGGEILKSILPQGDVAGAISGVASDAVAGKITAAAMKNITGPILDEAEANALAKSVDSCRFRIVRIPLYNSTTISLGLAIVDTKGGTAHLVFAAPRRKLATGGEFQGAIVTGDITIPEEGKTAPHTIMVTRTTYLPE